MGRLFSDGSTMGIVVKQKGDAAQLNIKHFNILIRLNELPASVITNMGFSAMHLFNEYFKRLSY